VASKVRRLQSALHPHRWYCFIPSVGSELTAFFIGQYAAPLLFVDKPGGWSSKESELRYLWDIFARGNVTDTECFCQLTRANDSIIKENMSRVMRQSIAAQNNSARTANIDVGASRRPRSSLRRLLTPTSRCHDGSPSP
jgi:hypothetical protein